MKIYIHTFPQTSWPIRYRFASKTDEPRLYSYLQLFAKEFSKYPKSFIVRTGLEKIIVVKDLQIYGQLRAAIPDFYRENLLLDFLNSTGYAIYQKHVIHHEYYHMIEEQFNQSPYWQDPSWNRLNPSGTRYGAGGVTVQNQINMYTYSHPRLGFVNLYSLSGLEEDKAEIFASLFVREEWQLVQKWQKTDRVLFAKVRYMQEFLREIDTSFTREYWARLER
ncbi:MAG: hypothetical protein AAF518_10950 [Spirochaetota bacterium]